MPPQTVYRIAAALSVAFALFILWVIYLANTGSKSIAFEFVYTTPYADKFGHFILFGILTFIVTIALKFRCLHLKRLKVYYSTLAVSVFVLFEEISQAFIPTRTFDTGDLLADSLGILSATALAYLIHRYWLKHHD